MLDTSKWESTKCHERYEDYQKRKDKYESEYKAFEIDDSCAFHRLIKYQELEDGIIDKDAFSDKSLSVYIESKEFPSFDIKAIVEKSKSTHAGAYKVPASLFFEGNFAIVHDPFPDDKGKDQHANHGQVFCSKPADLRRKLVEKGEWSVKPPKQDEVPEPFVELQEISANESNKIEAQDFPTTNTEPNPCCFERVINWFKKLLGLSP